MGLQILDELKNFLQACKDNPEMIVIRPKAVSDARRILGFKRDLDIKYFLASEEPRNFRYDGTEPPRTVQNPAVDEIHGWKFDTSRFKDLYLAFGQSKKTSHWWVKSLHESELVRFPKQVRVAFIEALNKKIDIDRQKQTGE